VRQASSIDPVVDDARSVIGGQSPFQAIQIWYHTPDSATPGVVARRTIDQSHIDRRRKW